MGFGFGGMRHAIQKRQQAMEAGPPAEVTEDELRRRLVESGLGGSEVALQVNVAKAIGGSVLIAGTLYRLKKD